MENGYLMSKGRIVGRVEDGSLTVYQPKLCPLFLLRVNDPEGWLKARSIDAHRTNSRLLRKALRLAPNDDLAAVLRVHGMTITDCYWYRPDTEQRRYEDLVFRNDEFSELALRGDPDVFNQGSKASRSPELTNIGSYEKCWKLMDGKWWMVKSGEDIEQFCEVFAYNLGTRLGLNMAYYERDGVYVRTRDFTDGLYNFEPAYSLVGDDEDYTKSYDAVSALSSSAAREYVGMTYFDALYGNMDRHTLNYGVLRDQDTGETLCLAPLFDHNIAFVSRGYPADPTVGSGYLQSLFLDLLHDRPAALKDYLELSLKEPTRGSILDALQASAAGFPPEIVRTEEIVTLLLSRARWLSERVSALSSTVVKKTYLIAPEDDLER